MSTLNRKYIAVMINDIDYVAAEYGVAKYRGTNVITNAERLIKRDNPKFRDEFEIQAYEAGLAYDK